MNGLSFSQKMLISFIVLFAGQLLLIDANATIQDGSKSFDLSSSGNKFNETNQPEVSARSFNYATQSRAINKWIAQRQVDSNQIGTGLSKVEINEPFNQAQLLNAHKYNTFGDMGRYRHSKRRGFMVTKARAVESPALSIDSGGQTSSSLAKEIAKVLDIKQGHYGDDFYKKIDKIHEVTKKPADAIEETIRHAVHRFMAKRLHHHRHQHRHRHNKENTKQQQSSDNDIN